MIRATGLRKLFGDFVAVDAIDLDIPAGTWFLFVGHNGAGKTTTIKMLAGLLPPSSGQVVVARLHEEDINAMGSWLAAQPLPVSTKPASSLPSLSNGAKANDCGSAPLAGKP